MTLSAHSVRLGVRRTSVLNALRARSVQATLQQVLIWCVLPAPLDRPRMVLDKPPALSVWTDTPVLAALHALGASTEPGKAPKTRQLCVTYAPLARPPLQLRLRQILTATAVSTVMEQSQELTVSSAKLVSTLLRRRFKTAPALLALLASPLPATDLHPLHSAQVSCQHRLRALAGTPSFGASHVAFLQMRPSIVCSSCSLKATQG